jgi:hypothetical protein
MLRTDHMGVDFADFAGPRLHVGTRDIETPIATPMIFIGYNKALLQTFSRFAE